VHGSAGSPLGAETAVAQAAAFPHAWRGALILVAGFYGAFGVVLAALAAHLKGGTGLSTAADFLMIHACLVVSLCALAGQVTRPRAWLFVGTMVLVAVTFFSGDITLSSLASRRLFPMAAPTGGTLLILSWLGVSLLAAVEMTDTRRA